MLLRWTVRTFENLYSGAVPGDWERFDWERFDWERLDLVRNYSELVELGLVCAGRSKVNS